MYLCEVSLPFFLLVCIMYVCIWCLEFKGKRDIRKIRLSNVEICDIFNGYFLQFKLLFETCDCASLLFI